MHKINSYCTSMRLISQLRNSKILSNPPFKVSYNIECSSSPCCAISRIICTDKRCYAYSNLHYKHDTIREQESICYHSPFLKENFNIIDNRYFKLISVSSDTYLEELLKKEEFKEVLSRSTFFFDVQLTDNSKFEYSAKPAVTMHSFQNIASKINLLSREESSTDIYQGYILCSKSESNENNSDKPTEQQLCHIINSLTYSLINFFEKPHDYSIYHRNIVFQNNIRGVKTKGLNAYIQAMYLLKLYGLLHYAKVKVEILKITHHIEDGTVRVRWRVNGISRQQILMHIWKTKKLELPQYGQDDTEWLDGFSIFSVGSDGLIYKHICDKLTPSHETSKVKKSLKSKILGLIELSQRGPAGSLHALISCYRNQPYTNCKKIT